MNCQSLTKLKTETGLKKLDEVWKFIEKCERYDEKQLNLKRGVLEEKNIERIRKKMNLKRLSVKSAFLKDFLKFFFTYQEVPIFLYVVESVNAAYNQLKFLEHGLKLTTPLIVFYYLVFKTSWLTKTDRRICRILSYLTIFFNKNIWRHVKRKLFGTLKII